MNRRLLATIAMFIGLIYAGAKHARPKEAPRVPAPAPLRPAPVPAPAPTPEPEPDCPT